MESRFTKPLRTYYPPLNSLDSSKTLPSSPPNNTGNLQDNLSSCSESTIPDSEYSDCDGLLEGIEVDDTDFEYKNMCNFSPVRSFSSHWSQPWSNVNDRKPAELPLSVPGAVDIKASLSDRSLVPDSNAKPLFMSLLARFKPPIVGAGLENLGNTCFLNAVMQCFTHTVPLLTGLISSKHRFPCDVSRYERFCVLCALFGHFNLSLTYMGKVVSPWALVNNLNYISSGFSKYQQEDAHEFLQCFLDKLENCWNDAKMNDSSSDSSSNIVTQVFGGRLVSTLRCCNCDHRSDTYEPLIDLSLEIEDTDSLYGALDSFTKVEKIEDPEMKFTCQKCKEQVFVEKQLMLDQTPSIAAFHLKRFKSDGFYVEKIDKPVSFPLELNLRSYTAGCQNQAELMYDLYAVVVHIGFSSNSGHYYCFIRSAPQMWYKFDDEQVSWVDEELVLSEEAYILFYAKRGTPCFANFIEARRNSMYIPVVNTSPKSVFDNADASTSSSSLPSECQIDGHETNDAVDEASTITNEKVEECSRANEENHMPDLTPLVVSNSLFTSEFNAKVNDSDDVDVDVDVVRVSNLANDVATRPRSQSPEIYKEDPPDKIFSSGGGGGDSGTTDDKVPNVEMEEDDIERKQEARNNELTGLKLIAGMRGSHHGEGSIAIKKRGRGTHPFLNNYQQLRNSRHKGGFD